jgi:hypothetical protein
MNAEIQSMRETARGARIFVVVVAVTETRRYWTQVYVQADGRCVAASVRVEGGRESRYGSKNRRLIGDAAVAAVRAAE